MTYKNYKGCDAIFIGDTREYMRVFDAINRMNLIVGTLDELIK